MGIEHSPTKSETVADQSQPIYPEIMPNACGGHNDGCLLRTFMSEPGHLYTLPGGHVPQFTLAGAVDAEARKLIYQKATPGDPYQRIECPDGYCHGAASAAIGGPVFFYEKGRPLYDAENCPVLTVDDLYAPGLEAPVELCIPMSPRNLLTGN